MKTALLILYTLAGSFASAQDSLKIQNRPIIPVTITSIDHQQGLLHYTSNGVSRAVDLAAVERYYFQDKPEEEVEKIDAKQDSPKIQNEAISEDAQDSLKIKNKPIIAVTITSIDQKHGLLHYTSNGVSRAVDLAAVERYYFQDKPEEENIDAKQDSLQLQNGPIIPVTITIIDHLRRQLHYKSNGVNNTVDLASVERYYFQGKWNEKSAKIESNQDSLKLLNASLIQVTITSISHQQGLVHYIHNGVSHAVVLSAVERYYFQGTWTENAKSVVGKKMEVNEESQGYYGYFYKTTPYEMSTWSVATNIVALLTNIESDNYQYSYRDYYYSDVPSLTIEPEYRINDHFAVKFNALIGLNALKQPRSAYNYNSWKSDPAYATRPWGRITYDLETWYAPTETLSYFQDGSNYFPEYPHNPNPNVIYQVGVFPKYYFNHRRKRAIYVSAGVSTGVADYQSVDYFHSFVYGEQDPSQNRVKWILDKQDVRTRSNQFTFFRFDASAGINFNLTEQFAFAFEAGIYSTIKNKGFWPDKVFVQFNDGDFTHLTSAKYEMSVNPTEPRSQLLLIYRFKN